MDVLQRLVDLFRSKLGDNTLVRCRTGSQTKVRKAQLLEELQALKSKSITLGNQRRYDSVSRAYLNKGEIEILGWKRILDNAKTLAEDADGGEKQYVVL